MAQAHLYYGIHSKEGIADVRRIEQQIRQYLDYYPNGRVHWLYETVSLSRPYADYVSYMMEAKGYKPSQAFVNSLFSMKHQRFNELSQEVLANDDLVETASDDNEVTYFVRECELAMNRLYRDYGNRFGLLVEGYPHEQMYQLRMYSELRKSAENFLINLPNNYPKLKRIEVFKQHVMAYDRYISARDDNLTGRIIETLNHPDTLAIVGHLGMKHIHVGEYLRRAQYQSYDYPDPSLINYPDPTDLIYSRIVFSENGYQEIGDNEWAMYAAADYTWRRTFVRTDEIQASIKAHDVINSWLQNPEKAYQRYIREGFSWLTRGVP